MQWTASVSPHNHVMVIRADSLFLRASIILVYVCITSLQAASKMIKETMDKKFGATWHAVVGAGFGFEIAYDCKNLLYMFFGGNTAICLWKCA